MARISDATKQRTVAYLSGRGQHRALTTRRRIGPAVLMRPLQSASIGNKKDHWYVGRSSGRIRRRACGLPYLASGGQLHPPGRVPSLFFDVCVTAPETRPLPVVLRAHPTPQHRPIVQWRLTGGTAIPPSRHPRGWSAIVLSRYAPPVAPSPGRFATFRARCCVDRLMGSRHQELHRGPAGDRPPLCCAHAGDPTPIMPVKGRYSGKIRVSIETL